jgi:hypothetical protein
MLKNFEANNDKSVTNAEAEKSNIKTDKMCNSEIAVDFYQS